MNTNLTKFDQLKADIQLYVAPIKTIVVNSVASQEDAMISAKELKARLKRIEDLRKELKAPYKQAGDEIDAYAKTLEALLTEPGKHLETQLLAWNRELEKVRQAELERIRKEERARQEAADKAAKEAMDLAAFEKEIGNDEAAANAELVVQAEYDRNEAKAIETVKAEMKKVDNIKVKGVTLRWDFTVYDLSKVPLEFLKLDEVAVRKAIVDSKGERQIPGIEAFQKESLTIR